MKRFLFALILQVGMIVAVARYSRQLPNGLTEADWFLVILTVLIAISTAYCAGIDAGLGHPMPQDWRERLGSGWIDEWGTNQNMNGVSYTVIVNKDDERILLFKPAPPPQLIA